MARLAVNQFQSWELDAEELLQGSMFHDLQLKVLQNELAKAAAEKITLLYDPLNPMQFVQREAELQGQIGLIQYLIANHEAALQTRAAQSQGE